MTYRVTTIDISAEGMERLRNRDEFILLASVDEDSTVESVKSDLLDDIDSCDRGDWFDGDKAECAINEVFDDQRRHLQAVIDEAKALGLDTLRVYVRAPEEAA